jgi:hypothetical protein
MSPVSSPSRIDNPANNGSESPFIQKINNQTLTCTVHSKRKTAEPPKTAQTFNMPLIGTHAFDCCMHACMLGRAGKTLRRLLFSLCR